jgi:hypothetical protein
MPRVPSPTESPELWDSVYIGGVRVPGVVRISGGHSRREDSEAVPGQDGVTTTILGYEPAEFSVEVLLWGERDYDAYMDFYHRFKPRKTDPKAAQALSVSHHAAFIIADVQTLTIFEITVPRQTRDQQYTATMRLREFIPKTQRTTKVGKTTGVKNLGPDPSLARGTGAPSALGNLQLNSAATRNPLPGLGGVDDFSVEGAW